MEQRWPIIQNALTALQRLAETHMADMDNIKVKYCKCSFFFQLLLLLFYRMLGNNRRMCWTKI